MSDTTVHWCKTWDGPVIPASECRHEGPDALTINQRLERNERGKGHHIAVSGDCCMSCGTDRTGNFTVAETLRLCMDQHGWNREVGNRLHDLAAAHEEELMQAPAIPIWCFYAFGWSGREVHEALNSGKLNPARMSEEVEKLAAEINPHRVVA